MRPHGSYVKYVVEKCRCEDCRQANRVYGRRRCRERSERRWGVRPPLFVDAVPVREHLDVLRAAGIGRVQLQEITGVGHTALWKIATGRVRRCTPQTAEAILGVTCTDHVAMRSQTDAARAKEIIDWLRQQGWTKTRIAMTLGYKTGALQIGETETCTLRTLRRLETLQRLVLRDGVAS
jgi:hypothetical protein